MKKIIALLTLPVLISASAAFGAGTNDLTGNWKGTLNAGAAKLRLVFKISKAADGNLTAKMDSLDLGARDIPVETVSVKDKAIHLEVKSVHGVYEGTWDAAGTKIIGQWQQGLQPMPLTLERVHGTNFAAEAMSPAEFAASKIAAPKLAGVWNGSMVAGPANLRLRVNISKTAAGAAVGTMDSLDQGANGIPLSAITCNDGKVRFEARGIGGVYEGTLSSDGAALAGQWQQAGQTMPLDFKKATAAP